MTRARAEEIARSLGKRHIVIHASQRCVVVNVARALAKGTPVTSLYVSPDLDAPILTGSDRARWAPLNRVWEEPK